MWGSIAGGLLSSLGPSLLGGLFGSSSDLSGAANAASQMSQYDPIGLTTGFGTSSFDPTTHAGTFSLNPVYESLRNGFLSGAKGFLGSLNSYNPMQAAQQYANNMNTIMQPEIQRQQNALENRLSQQGILNSTSGDNKMRVFQDSLNNMQLQNANTAFMNAQNVQNDLLNNAKGMLSAGTGIDQLGTNQLGLGLNAGGTAANAGYRAAQFPWANAQNVNDANNAFWGQIGNAVSGSNLFGGSNTNNSSGSSDPSQYYWNTLLGPLWDLNYGSTG